MEIQLKTAEDIAKVAAAKKSQQDKAKAKAEKLEKQSPAKTGGGGSDTGTEGIDIESLTPEEFDALPKATVQKLLQETV